MPTRFELTTQPVRAGRLFLLALVTTFIGELAIMKILPHILPSGWDDTSEAFADACLLTLVVAPFYWAVAVRPIERLAQSRMHFLRRALTSQEEERRRITQDLHDGLGQSLTSLMLGLRAMEETTTDARIREQEVLTLVAQGHTNQAIADRLYLSVKTVESYRSRLMTKLNLGTRAELTQFALKLGLLQSEQ